MTWTTHSAAPEWGIDRKTLRRRLADAGHDLEKRKEFTTREISEAIYGDEKLERIKGHRLDNERKEIENAEAKKQLMSSADVAEFLTAVLLPVKQKLDSLPDEKARCNPTDPNGAELALEAWLDSALRQWQASVRSVNELAEAAKAANKEADAGGEPS